MNVQFSLNLRIGTFCGGENSYPFQLSNVMARKLEWNFEGHPMIGRVKINTVNESFYISDYCRVALDTNDTMHH